MMAVIRLSNGPPRNVGNRPYKRYLGEIVMLSKQLDAPTASEQYFTNALELLANNKPNPGNDAPL